MTWNSLMDVLAVEFQRLRLKPTGNFGFFFAAVLDPKELAEEEGQHARRIDRCIRDFSWTGKWPVLSEKERYFLRQRLRFAYEYASIASISVRDPARFAKPGPTRGRDRRIIEHFLISIWRSSGFDNWIFPFIQLEETKKGSPSSSGEAFYAE